MTITPSGLMAVGSAGLSYRRTCFLLLYVHTAPKIITPALLPTMREQEDRGGGREAFNDTCSVHSGSGIVFHYLLNLMKSQYLRDVLNCPGKVNGRTNQAKSAKSLQ